jgi:hypothetical protein
MPLSEQKAGNELLFCTVAVVLTAVCLAPVIFTSFFEPAVDADYHGFFKIVLLAAPVIIVMLCYGVKIHCPPKQKLAVFLLLIALTLLLVNVHRIYIDTTSSYFGDRTNTAWQVELHRSVVSLSPKTLPHSYRFLPNSMVRFAEFLTGDFAYARSLYRHAMMFPLLFFIYYYARIRHSHEKALLTVLMYSAVYPISIRYYAGQLVDPLSHLSFILAFIFLELELFLCFALTILIGIMAKESILVMPVFFLLFRRKEENYPAKAIVLLVACAAMVACIRLWIVPGRFFANNVFVLDNLGGTALPHLLKHMGNFSRWGMQVLCAVGIFVPFLILAWKRARPELRNLACFLLVTLLLSNFLFSWPNETRNLIPAIIPLALITSDYLLRRQNALKA